MNCSRYRYRIAASDQIPHRACVIQCARGYGVAAAAKDKRAARVVEQSMDSQTAGIEEEGAVAGEDPGHGNRTAIIHAHGRQGVG